MRSLLILLFCFSAFNSKAMPTDTITVWQLDFNGKKYSTVFPYSYYNEKTISKDTLTNESTFSIRKTAGCLWWPDRTFYFAVYGQNEKLVQVVKGVNPDKSLKMSLRELLAYHKRTGEVIFDFYYSLSETPTLKSAVHVIRLTLVD
ncbi:MAG: hypothetical protein GQ574_01345 [Crocinitomix sp.]|nr:hypothetical protein [Crocinitomix sp.]